MDVFGGCWENHLENIAADWREKVTDGDIVLISGDISWAMKLEDAIGDFDYFDNLPGTKVFIKGNHEYWWNSIGKIRSALGNNNKIFIQNDAVKIGNVVICGSRGWTVEGSPDFNEEDKKIYLRETERLRLSLKCAEKLRCEGDKLIVMVHFPPFNVKREPSNFTELFEKNNVNAVIYGHLHGKDARSDLKLRIRNVDYYLASCDLVKNVLQKINIEE